MYTLVRKAVLAGLGARVALNRWVDDLVEQGKADHHKDAVKVRELVDEGEKTARKVEQAVKDGVSSMARAMRRSTRADLETLEQRIQELSRRVDTLSQGS